MHMQTLVTCLKTLDTRLHARIPGSAPAVDLDPEQPYGRPWIGADQGANGWVDASMLYHFNHPQKATRIALSTTR